MKILSLTVLSLLLLTSCGPTDEDMISQIRKKHQGLFEKWYDIKIVKKEERSGGKGCDKFHITWEAIAKKKLLLNPYSKFSKRRQSGKTYLMAPEAVIASEMEQGLKELRSVASANIGKAGKHCGNIGRAQYNANVDCKKFGDYKKCIKSKECKDQAHADEYMKIITQERKGKYTNIVEVGQKAFGNDNTVCL